MTDKAETELDDSFEEARAKAKTFKDWLAIVLSRQVAMNIKIIAVLNELVDGNPEALTKVRTSIGVTEELLKDVTGLLKSLGEEGANVP